MWAGLVQRLVQKIDAKCVEGKEDEDDIVYVRGIVSREMGGLWNRE